MGGGGVHFYWNESTSHFQIVRFIRTKSTDRSKCQTSRHFSLGFFVDHSRINSVTKKNRSCLCFFSLEAAMKGHVLYRFYFCNLHLMTIFFSSAIVPNDGNFKTNRQDFDTINDKDMYSDYVTICNIYLFEP